MRKKFEASVQISVLSFNRGQYLQNCVQSIERHAPNSSIKIFDDASTCPETRDILKKLANKHEVFINENSTLKSHLKGLYQNMNWALQIAKSHGFEFVFFIQDDQQIVRKLDENFYEEIKSIFASSEQICQITPTFFKGFLPEHILYSRFNPNEKFGYYLSDCGIGDTGITHLYRLEEKKFLFQNSEGDSSKLALSLGLRAAQPKNPVLMYTPWPRVARNIQNPIIRLLFSLNQLGVKAGCNPFFDMDQRSIERLLKRPLSVLPIAENFLRTKKKLRMPWWYSDPFDLKKMKSIKNLVFFRWLFDGPAEYMELRNSLQKEKPHPRETFLDLN